MPQVVACPACGKNVRVPDDAAGKRFRCKGCEMPVSIRDAGQGRLSLHAAPLAAPARARARAPSRASAIVPRAASARAADSAEGPDACPACGAALDRAHTFCTACGKALVGAAASAGTTRSRAPRHRRRAGDRGRRHSIGRATGWVLAVGIMFAVFGTAQGCLHADTVERAHANLAGFAADDELDFQGEVVTAGELRARIDTEARMIFVVNYGLAAVMIGLWFWARSAPFPALLTALCVYLAVLVLNALVDPSTIMSGLFLKIIVISALGLGLKAAAGQRAMERARAAA